ncbi:MAG: hypothetical protein ACOC80_14565 [Petrotogales bacterium]
MKDYLKSLIAEQINRGMVLKSYIPHPLNYTELSSLADRCCRKIDENIDYLRYLNEELATRENEDIRDIFRQYRRCAREIELVESYGIQVIHSETEKLGYLNKLIFKIHNEINLPLNPPCVSCISTKYFYYQPFTDVIFLPIGESDFLLHIPDILHELGHEVIQYKDKQLKLEGVKKSYNESIGLITEHYRELLKSKMRQTGPEDIPLIIRHIHSQWKDYWIEEIFADLLAVFTLGPAYVWSHLHLTAKKSRNVYDFSTILPREHPSDDARLKMMLIALKLLGFEDISQDIKTKWDKLPVVSNINPNKFYHFAYPNELMEDIVKILLKGVTDSNFSIIDPKKLSELEDDSIISILNQSWEKFWNEPDTYRDWEREVIGKLQPS